MRLHGARLRALFLRARKTNFFLWIWLTMADRLTQLQVCVDQLVEQFNAAVNYVIMKSEGALLDLDPNSVLNKAANAPIPGQQVQSPEPDSARNTVANTTLDQPSARDLLDTNFDNTINELSTDIILKSRQISMLIDSLPGVGISEESQSKLIEELSEELERVEAERVAKIREKDEFLRWCEALVVEVASGISQTR